jgi:hypothetical protein
VSTFTTYSVGLVSASVCTDLPIEEATERLNDEHPTGIDSRWQPSDEPTFSGGQPQPCPCNIDPSLTHYLFYC